MITFLDFKINQISIFPDFIGILVVLSGCQTIALEDERIKKMIPWAYVALLTSCSQWLLSFFSNAQTSQKIGMFEYPILNTFLLIETISQMVFIILILMMMEYFIQITKENDEKDWTRIFERRKRFYFYVSVSLFILAPLIIFFPESLTILFIILSLLAFIAFIQILMTSYRVKELFREELLTIKQGEFEQTQFLKVRKKLMIIGILVISSWIPSYIKSAQMQVSEPILLPTFVAVGEDSDSLSAYVLHNEQDQGPYFSSFEGADHFTILRSPFFNVDQFQLRHETIKKLAEKEQNELVFSNGTTVDASSGYFHVFQEGKPGDDFLELIDEHTSGGEYTSTWRVLKTFNLVEEWSLPFTKELEPYFSYKWVTETQREKQNQFEKGDLITFILEPRTETAKIVSIEAPLQIRMKTETGGEHEVILSHIYIRPNITEQNMKEILMKRKH
ncbi:hypothetical protein [Halalkalibacter urbisdiaboli]|uniref:hypothetical protein n=1 Tax=Halalkalibacter urbisdiaboli TaxID=1960589 RepID=UPI000B43A3AA|nr:hypothetical protein [Halalkalibacter urbisdiaboli]